MALLSRAKKIITQEQSSFTAPHEANTIPLWKKIRH
jgi:hypothetical protein